MILFSTTQTDYLAAALPFKQGKRTIKRFSDGEIYVKIEEPREHIEHKSIWVLASTSAPADNLIELFFLLDALQRQRARISLLITYFGYERQDRAAPGEALSAEVIARCLQLFALEQIFIIHAHSAALHRFLSFKNIIPVSLVCPIAHQCDGIVAPDQGAHELAQLVTRECVIEPIFVTKMRPAQEHVEVTGVLGDIHDKTVLIIDDIISTGRTIVSVSTKLQELGARDVYVFATHGVFSGNARELIESSPIIKKVYVTNTLPQKYSPKIEIVTIVPFIEHIIRKETP
jgi:ribose-phosphate pyrophosphokinase